MSSEFIKNNSENSEETDRYVMVYQPENLPEIAKLMSEAAGIKMPSTVREALKISGTVEENEYPDVWVFPTIGAMVCSAPMEQIYRLETGRRSPIISIRKEYIFKVAGAAGESDINVSADYLNGYRAGVDGLISDLLGLRQSDNEAMIQASESFADDPEYTWGLQATGVNQSRLTGAGVKIALLDTGLDANHIDFNPERITSKSFIPGNTSVDDDSGHGTHCLGTLAGPAIPAQGRRYGIACDAQLFVGKVMKANGRGTERDILAGIDWAVQNGCRIVSMSLGTPVLRGALPERGYEEIGAAALKKNCLLIAAAGNDSHRPDGIEPVAQPANSKTIMAVGAIDRRLEIYPKSNGGINFGGGGIDLVAPGVDIYSSRPGSRYTIESGTSMATPHVAGIAALLMEADPKANAEQIWARLVQSAKRLPMPGTDVGSGLVQIS